jgi:glutathione-S-conjugate glycine hydrolase
MPATNFVKVIAVAAVTATIGGAAVAQKSAKPEALIYFLDPQSAELLAGAEKQDFMPLISRFVSEYQATFCGIASSVMALNALGIKPPTAPRWYPYNYWTQDNIFSAEVLKKVKPVSGIDAGGITLEQLQTLLNLSGAKAEKMFASDTGVDAFRKAARATIADPNAILIVNFGRAQLGQPGLDGGGHISPVAAYNAKTDRFLVLDVARYKFVPSWVTADRLYFAMNTPDSSSGKTRGYVIVRK